MKSTGQPWNLGLLARGESLVASGGATLAAVFVATLGATAWWAVHSESASRSDLARQRAVAVGTTLAESLDGLLAAGELTRARTLLIQTARSAGLSGCRVALPGDRVLADIEPSRLTERALPLDWPSGTVPQPTPGPGFDGQSFPISIADRGSAALEIEWADDGERGIWVSDLTMGFGGIGVVGLAGWAVAYRRMRNKVRGMGAVGDALRAAAGGEASTEALAVSAGFGAEAAAWNALLTDREALRQKIAEEKADVVLAGAGGARRDSDLAGACDALWLGLVIVDEKSVIRYINGAAAVLMGGSRDELLGKPVAEIVRDAPITTAISAAAAGASRQRTSIEQESLADSRRGVIRYTIRAMRREQAAAAMVLIEDVTQQRVADESRNSFVAQVTHELRTPLTNMKLYLETLLDGGDEDPATRAKCINVIGQEARRLERVVSDMLSVAEIEAGSLKLHSGDVRLDALFEEIENDFKAQAQDREIGMAFELPPKLPVIVGDRDKITLAVHNLIGNALKYTPVGGKVIVHVEADGKGVNVLVIDNGIGIKPDECELIFEKFYRAKDKRIAGITGSGLGLALARQVVRLHGGDIQVRSQIDKGSTFTMTLPLAQAA